jgi:hypothetical protein
VQRVHALLPEALVDALKYSLDLALAVAGADDKIICYE